MGVRTRRVGLFTLFTFLICGTAGAAPRLRLDTAALGPISIATGENGPTQKINALNAGEGSLNLTAASSDPWLTASVQPVASCGFAGSCIPIEITLATAGLNRGTYTGAITIADPAAVDAPQTVTVTVAVGGGVPDAMTLYVPRNGRVSKARFTTAGPVSLAAQSEHEGVTLSVALPGGGSFQAATSYQYTVSARAEMLVDEGSYRGSITVSGSRLDVENKTVPIDLNVTGKPILALLQPAVFRLAAGAAKQTQTLVAYNLGEGDLAVSALEVSTAAGDGWLSAEVVNSNIAITADAVGLSPGVYAGTVKVLSNAANEATAVPVRLEVIEPGPPVVYVKRLKSISTLSLQPFAPGDLCVLAGEQFTTGERERAPNGSPWPTTLAGATAYFNDVPAPLYGVSGGEIYLQIPYETAPGEAILRVERDGQTGNSTVVSIVPSAPKLGRAVTADSMQVSTPELVFSDDIRTGGAGAVVHPGDTVTITGTGFGVTEPAVASGVPSPEGPGSMIPGTIEVVLGTGGVFSQSAVAAPSLAGLAPNTVGQFQITFQIPADSPTGPAVPVRVRTSTAVSNTLLFNIQ